MKKLTLFLGGILLFCCSAAFGQTDTPRTINGGVINGKALSLPAPKTPAAARAVGVCGTVSVQVMIDEEGKVSSAEAVSGHPLLRSAAVRAAQEASFKPTTLSGEPTKVSGIIVYRFICDSEIIGPREEEPPVDYEAEDLINGGVINGKAIKLPKPAYPAAARAVGASGSVSVRVIIDENGKVIAAEAVTGHPLLRSASVQAATAAEFETILLNDQAVKVSGIIVYVFKLPFESDPPEEEGGNN